MRKVNLACLVLFAICSLTSSIQLSAEEAQNKNQCHKSQLVEFDAPGAATVSSPLCAPGCGTFANDNNDLGVIVGYYTDPNIVPHGFLRTPDGHFVSFDAPGAGLGSGLNQGTVAYAINDVGAIAGQYQDSSYVFHGFVRNGAGHFTTFDAPGAGTGAYQGTQALNINIFGTTAGIYIDASYVYHGFVRSPLGDFSTFDPTGSVYTYVCNETCLTPDGTIAGFYFDSTGLPHGFVRKPDGSIKSIDAPPPAGLTTLLTITNSINPAGVIGGYAVDSNSVAHAFLRHPDGSFTSFDDPDAGDATGAPPQGTYPDSINFLEAATGTYFDASYNAHGFERFPDGHFANFDAPDAAPGSAAGTRPSTNNAEGEVTGYYTDAGGLNHGFLWIP